VDLRSDTGNSGRCENGCGQGEMCKGGDVCVAEVDGEPGGQGMKIGTVEDVGEC
jgi:hypothetical protein